MKNFAGYFKWLTIAALVDWLITRTLTRVGIFVPKTPFFVSLYQIFSQFGQFASTFASLLALVGLIWIAWQIWKSGSNRYLTGLLGIQAGLSLLFLIVLPGGWILLLAHLIFVGCVVGLGSRLVLQRPLLIVPVSAYLFGALYQIVPTLTALIGKSGPSANVGWIFNLGEMFVMGSGLVFWWYWGVGKSGRAWVLAAVPASLFCMMVLFAPAMTGILSIWSTGLTLYLPWPLYALGLWLTGGTVIQVFQRGESRLGYGILLLIAGGYVPQLSSHIFFGLIGLWLLFEARENRIIPATEYGYHFAAQSLNQ